MSVWGLETREFTRQHQYCLLFIMPWMDWCEMGVITVGHRPPCVSIPDTIRPTFAHSSFSNEVWRLDKKGSSEGNIRTLSVKLAKEAVFGMEVMVRCTPGGTCELPGLPTRWLVLLKKMILSQFPQYWKCLHVFEGIWKKCRDSIKQACKRERKNVLLQLVPKVLNGIAVRWFCRGFSLIDGLGSKKGKCFLWGVLRVIILHEAAYRHDLSQKW